MSFYNLTKVYMDTYKPAYAIKLSAKNFGFEDNKKIVPLYAAFYDFGLPLHSFHFQKIKKFLFLKVTSCIYY